VAGVGNAEAAVGQWDLALSSYQEAAKDPEMEAIALANYALASFEVGREEQAVRTARQLLRRCGTASLQRHVLPQMKKVK
jgi:tetratricopeptide (TPR) repeat protein